MSKKSVELPPKMSRGVVEEEGWEAGRPSPRMSSMSVLSSSGASVGRDVRIEESYVQNNILNIMNNNNQVIFL